MSDNFNRGAPDEQALPAALLDGFDPVEPAPDVWSNILAEINTDAPNGAASPEPTGHRSARSGRWTPWLMSVAAVVMLVLGAAVVLTNQSGDVYASRDLVDPSTSSVVLTVDSSVDGSSVVVGSDLPELPVGQTYQLWAVTGDEIVSVGLLGSDVAGAEFRIEGQPAILALTVEVSGGVAVSEQDPVAVWQA